jgi:hypothetical protein
MLLNSFSFLVCLPELIRRVVSLDRLEAIWNGIESNQKTEMRGDFSTIDTLERIRVHSAWVLGFVVFSWIATIALSLVGVRAAYFGSIEDEARIKEIRKQVKSEGTKRLFNLV